MQVPVQPRLLPDRGDGADPAQGAHQPPPHRLHPLQVHDRPGPRILRGGIPGKTPPKSMGNPGIPWGTPADPGGTPNSRGSPPVPAPDLLVPPRRLRPLPRLMKQHLPEFRDLGGLGLGVKPVGTCSIPQRTPNSIRTPQNSIGTPFFLPVPPQRDQIWRFFPSNPPKTWILGTWEREIFGVQWRGHLHSPFSPKFSLDLPKMQQEERPIRQILYLGELLETCHFQSFWVSPPKSGGRGPQNPGGLVLETRGEP